MPSSRFDAGKRLAICKARGADPRVSTRTLAATFKTSVSTIIEALRAGADHWERVLAGEPVVEGEGRPEPRAYLCIVAEPVLRQGTVVGYRHAEHPGGAWVDVPCRSVAGVIEALAADGWVLAGLARVPGPGGPFEGTYELVLAGGGA